MNTEQYLEALGISETADSARERMILAPLGDNIIPPAIDHDEVRRHAELLEAEAIELYFTAVGDASDEGLSRRSQQLFEQAFSCWLQIAEAEPISVSAQTAQDTPLTLFRIAVCGVAGRRVAEARFNLSKLLPAVPAELGDPVASESWARTVMSTIVQAVVLLTRKADGWNDVDRALDALNRLRRLQEQREQVFLDEQGDNEVGAAFALVAAYHTAQLITLVGDYLITGEAALEGLLVRLDRHHDKAQIACQASGDADLVRVADLTWVAGRELARNSIWAHALGLGDEVARFARILAARGRPNPVLELWPSQQEAFARNILDPYRRAVLVEMPTSAGKTLLAKFAIVQTKNLQREGTVAYTVPTRALVNQLTADLRADLGLLGLTVEPTVSAFELDPAEDALLSNPPDVLVTTPEKLDLLLRRSHPAVSSLAMVVVDEAHNLADGARGARLELVLATVRRDRPGVRFLLLSPFVPKADDLVVWLGGDRYLPPIVVDWKPGRRVVGVVQVTGRGKHRELSIETLDAADNADVSPGKVVRLGQVTGAATTIKTVSRLAARHLNRRGNTLVLCWGPASAMKRAAEIAPDYEEIAGSGLREMVRHYVDAELGDGNTLSYLLRRGVAYHHSGLSHDTRWLIETLVKRGEVHTICGTTTLAQGVNFPISNVLIEDRRKGRAGTLTYADFWNIAGRAGRTLLDDVGVVAFPVANRDQRARWQTFLRGEAKEISSQLAEIIARVDEIGSKFDLDIISRVPALSDFLQFLAHALRVGGYHASSQDVEDLLRSSLVYHQHRRTDPIGTAKLVRLCRSYLEQVSRQPGVVALSDHTGFSTPSVFKLLAHRRQDPSLVDPNGWDPEILFRSSDEQPLAARIRAIGDVPEVRLGSERAGSFNPQRIARILRGWVNGVGVAELAAEYGAAGPDIDKQVAEFAGYLYGTLLGRASWGLGALATVCLGGDSEEAAASVPDAARYLPSMVFFGVGEPEAVWLRMAGAPRLVAPGLATLWRARMSGAIPESLDSLRRWVDALDDAAWAQVVPPGPLKAREMRLLWQECLRG
jgi:hypothetical protein